MAEVSKLPDTAPSPLFETAKARTGPPCPRNCADTGAGATNVIATMIDPTLK
jgi:hypothetical protein